MTHYSKKLKVNNFVFSCVILYIYAYNANKPTLLGHTSKLLREIEENGHISDDSEVLLSFCCVLEKIFYCGLSQSQNKFGFIKNTIEPWNWLEKFARIQNSTISFAFKSAVDKTTANCTVQSDLGRFRLLIRLCLVAKCLHEPLQYLVKK